MTAYDAIRQVLEHLDAHPGCTCWVRVDSRNAVRWFLLALDEHEEFVILAHGARKHCNGAVVRVSTDPTPSEGERVWHVGAR